MHRQMCGYKIIKIYLHNCIMRSMDVYVTTHMPMLLVVNNVAVGDVWKDMV